VFTATAPETTEGVIAFSRPIAIAGEHVEGLEVRFEAGAATRVIARSGQSAFERLLDSDAGARRLGKIAIVEATAPLANRHGSFKNPMLDGAAAPHVTFGATLPGTLTDPKTGNESAIHLDAMFDTAHLSVDGIDAHGTAHAILRDGIFAI
jgi:aminopeptidase